MKSIEEMVAPSAEIAGRLRILRKEAGLPQGDVALRAGVPQTTLSQWELGKLPDTVSAFARVTLALGHSPDRLLLSDPLDRSLEEARSDEMPQVVDDLMALTRMLRELNAVAEAQGEGPLPSTLIREHVEGLIRLVHGRSVSPVAMPAAGVRPSAAPLPSPEEAEKATAPLLDHMAKLSHEERAKLLPAATMLDQLYSTQRRREFQALRAHSAAPAAETSPVQKMKKKP